MKRQLVGIWLLKIILEKSSKEMKNNHWKLEEKQYFVQRCQKT